jgi:hypothetical protein
MRLLGDFLTKKAFFTGIKACVCQYFIARPLAREGLAGLLRYLAWQYHDELQGVLEAHQLGLVASVIGNLPINDFS